jgi:hypothetical protein
MKKILFLCDGDNFSNGAFRFIKQMNENDRVFIKGIFFMPIDYEQLISVTYMPVSGPFERLKAEEKRLVKQSKDRFIEQCDNARIKYHIHDINEGWDKDLFVKESRFADLVVISEELFCSNLFSEQPNFFMQEALRGAECPVMVVPENFKTLERIAFAYDGKKESMFALKQFAYLMAQYTDLPAEFVFIKYDKTSEIPNADLLQEYSRLHFDSLATSKLHFDAKKYFTTWLLEKKNVLLVTGSYARSAVSNLLNRSFTDHVIRDHTSPVFIAHTA